MLTYSLADLHGRLDLLEAALALLPDAHFVVLGDVIDRGPQGLGCVRRLLELESAGRVTLLWGNHEHMAAGALRRYLRYRSGGNVESFSAALRRFEWWMGNGGTALQREYGRFSVDAYPPELMEYLSRLKLRVFVDASGVHDELPGGPCVLLSHAAPPCVVREYPDEFTVALWARPHEGPFAMDASVAWSVHGHTPVGAPCVVGRHVYTDTGAYLTGRLCLVRLDPEGPSEVLVVAGEGVAGAGRLSVLGRALPAREVAVSRVSSLS